MNRDSSNLQLFCTSSKQSFTNTDPEKSLGANTLQGLISYQNKLNIQLILPSKLMHLINHRFRSRNYKHTDKKDCNCNPDFGRHTFNDVVSHN